jgi:GNAT superfamily N-acetyltransferase
MTAVSSVRAGRIQPPRVLRRFDDALEISTFDARHRDAFKRLNEAWLNKYFRVEPIDERVLGAPEEEILAPGGEILFATLGTEVVGTVALKAEPDGPAFELTKMAVDERHQGRHYGSRLLEAACELARERGAERIILFSQRSLQTAVTMYFGHGFIELPNSEPRYARCDIKMERLLR